jgi:class 3 adenylate cyclase
MKVERRLAAIMMADAAGYSRLMSQDETATVRTLIAHRGVMDLLIVEHGGRIANTAGDSVLAEFASAGDALRAAVAIQGRLGEINAGLPQERRLQFRIGVHVGEVVPRGQDLLGDGVNIAARVQSLAPSGGVTVSGAAHVHVRKMAGFAFRDLGARRLKNIDEPMHVFSVAAEAPAAPGAMAGPETQPDGPDSIATAPEAQRPRAPALAALPRPGAPAAAAIAGGIVLAVATAWFVLGRHAEPPATVPSPSAVAPAPLAVAPAPLAVAPAPPAADAPAAPPAARLTLLAAPEGSSCQAQLYQMQPRFAETPMDVPADRGAIEVDGRALCGLAVAGATFQRGAGSALAASHSSASRVVFAQTGQPLAAPPLLLPGGGRVEIRIR